MAMVQTWFFFLHSNVQSFCTVLENVCKRPFSGQIHVLWQWLWPLLGKSSMMLFLNWINTHLAQTQIWPLNGQQPGTAAVPGCCQKNYFFLLRISRCTEGLWWGAFACLGGCWTSNQCMHTCACELVYHLCIYYVCVCIYIYTYVIYVHTYTHKCDVCTLPYRALCIALWDLETKIPLRLRLCIGYSRLRNVT